MVNEDPFLFSFWDHAEELRKTLVYCFSIIFIGFFCSLYFFSDFFNILTSPLDQKELILLGPLDGILTTVKSCFWLSLSGTSPLWLFFVIRFVTPALKLKEKKILFSFAVAAPFFFLLGALFTVFITIPLANDYFYRFNSQLGTNLWSLNHYIDYTLILILGNGLAFEICLLLFFLVHFGILTPPQMVSKRRYAILIAFILGALFTPPDVFTQLFLALPMIAIYELSILYGRLMTRNMDIN